MISDYLERKLSFMKIDKDYDPRKVEGLERESYMLREEPEEARKGYEYYGFAICTTPKRPENILPKNCGTGKFYNRYTGLRQDHRLTEHYKQRMEYIAEKNTEESPDIKGGYYNIYTGCTYARPLTNDYHNRITKILRDETEEYEKKRSVVRKTINADHSGKTSFIMDDKKFKNILGFQFAAISVLIAMCALVI